MGACPARPLSGPDGSIGQVDVQPAVVVVVEKGEAAAFGFNDVPLVVDAAPHVGSVEPGFCATSTNCTGRSATSSAVDDSRTEAAFHFHSGVVRASSSVLPRTRGKSQESAAEEKSYRT